MRSETYSSARKQVGGRFHKPLKEDEREGNAALYRREYTGALCWQLHMVMLGVHLSYIGNVRKKETKNR
jgi:hypothetical protein